MRKLLLSISVFLISFSGFSQAKISVGIMPFSDYSKGQNNYYNSRSNAQNQQIVSIQDAVTDAFLKTKRFTLVEREKMGQITGERQTQQSEDFIDGQVVEQSRSLGANYIVTGNVTEASFTEKKSDFSGLAGVNIADRNAKISFTLRVLDVETGQIVASEKFSASEKGKTAFEKAIETLKPQIDKFIKDNFKVTVSIANIEEKNATNEATKVLISGGTGVGLKPQMTLKVFELTSLMVDGKKIPRKKEIGQITVEKVEDENFSICKVITGGAVIATKAEAGANLKCEIIE